MPARRCWVLVRRMFQFCYVALPVQPHSHRSGHGSAYATVSDPTMIGGGGMHGRVPVITRVDQPLLSSSSPRGATAGAGAGAATAKLSPHHRHHHQHQQPQPVMPGPLPTSLATTAAPPHDGKYHARRVDKLSRKCFPVIFTVFNLIYWIFYSSQSIEPD